MNQEQTAMKKKYVVQLSDCERAILEQAIKTVDGSGQKIRRAHILLKADSNGPNWTDKAIATAFMCRTKTVENVRERFCKHGFELALQGQPRTHTPRSKKLDGEQEAQAIALRLGDAPEGFSSWSLRLWADKVVELGIVESVSPETLRQTLKQIR